MTVENLEDLYPLLSSDEEVEKEEDRELDEVPESQLWKKFGSALFYGIASFLLTVINKTVLTSWHFPSFIVISIGQLATAIIVLYISKKLSVISFPEFKRDVPRKIMPLPFFHFGNV